ncbi:MAG: hypothetical protein D6694_06045 [Gammaproteobacteria bacterium]|nr:MAG: hypothetical protein D6694_06045 [Gammaproteobacteria bacterium]
MKTHKLALLIMVLLGMQLSGQALNCMERADGCLICLDRANTDPVWGGCVGTDGDCIIIEVTCSPVEQ